jgi:hypothetical protein
MHPQVLRDEHAAACISRPRRSCIPSHYRARRGGEGGGSERAGSLRPCAMRAADVSGSGPTGSQASGLRRHGQPLSLGWMARRGRIGWISRMRGGENSKRERYRRAPLFLPPLILSSSLSLVPLSPVASSPWHSCPRYRDARTCAVSSLGTASTAPFLFAPVHCDPPCRPHPRPPASPARVVNFLNDPISTRSTACSRLPGARAHNARRCGRTARARAANTTKDFVPPDVSGLSKRETRLIKEQVRVRPALLPVRFVVLSTLPTRRTSSSHPLPLPLAYRPTSGGC